MNFHKIFLKQTSHSEDNIMESPFISHGVIVWFNIPFIICILKKFNIEIKNIF